MGGTDEADDKRLTGRMPRAPRRESVAAAPEAVDDPEVPADHDIEAVTKLMGFLRGDEVG